MSKPLVRSVRSRRMIVLLLLLCCSWHSECASGSCSAWKLANSSGVNYILGVEVVENSLVSSDLSPSTTVAAHCFAKDAVRAAVQRLILTERYPILFNKPVFHNEVVLAIESAFFVERMRYVTVDQRQGSRSHRFTDMFSAKYTARKHFDIFSAAMQPAVDNYASFSHKSHGHAKSVLQSSVVEPSLMTTKKTASITAPDSVPAIAPGSLIESSQVFPVRCLVDISPDIHVDALHRLRVFQPDCTIRIIHGAADFTGKSRQYYAEKSNALIFLNQAMADKWGHSYRRFNSDLRIVSLAPVMNIAVGTHYYTGTFSNSTEHSTVQSNQQQKEQMQRVGWAKANDDNHYYAITKDVTDSDVLRSYRNMTYIFVPGRINPMRRNYPAIIAAANNGVFEKAGINCLVMGNDDTGKSLSVRSPTRTTLAKVWLIESTADGGAVLGDKEGGLKSRSIKNHRRTTEQPVSTIGKDEDDIRKEQQARRRRGKRNHNQQHTLKGSLSRSPSTTTSTAKSLLIDFPLGRGIISASEKQLTDYPHYYGLIAGARAVYLANYQPERGSIGFSDRTTGNTATAISNGVPILADPSVVQSFPEFSCCLIRYKDPDIEKRNSLSEGKYPLLKSELYLNSPSIRAVETMQQGHVFRTFFEAVAWLAARNEEEVRMIRRHVLQHRDRMLSENGRVFSELCNRTER